MSFKQQVIFTLLAFAPTFLLLAIIMVWIYRVQGKSKAPVKDKLLRSPGRTLNQRLDRFDADFIYHLLGILAYGPLCFVLFFLYVKLRMGSPHLLGDMILFGVAVVLHPAQQNTLCRSLRKISATDGNQVLVSSHSPHFVSQNSDDIPAIIRLCRNCTESVSGQITLPALQHVFSDNQQINEMLKGTRYDAEADDLKEEMEAVKYFLWLDSERCGMFFARQVLMVEGATERVLLNYLLNTERIKTPKGGVFILDCLGKFNIHRFMNLVDRLNIPHSVLFDGDCEKPPHAKIKALIEGSRNHRTHKIDTFSDDIETFLGLPKSAKSHRKPQHAMFYMREGKIAPERVAALIAKVEGLIAY